MNRPLHHAAFLAGLLAIAWVAAGYIPGHPQALALVLPIAAGYLMGALELRRFQQATSGLAQLLAATTVPPPALAPWLAPLDFSLQNAVRLRVEGERVALPGPTLTPYLTGLLVLLGMLGTFLGMVMTLQGTGLALEQATDVEAIRASLAAPVKGLGLAFGTSVAGVAGSAMLGLMSALARRERLRTARQLDSCIAGPLHSFSQLHQRKESLRLLQTQAEVMPALVTQLQALVAQLMLQGQALHEGLLASQSRFQDGAQRAYTGLAESVDRSLKASLSDSVRLAAAAIEPTVQATMAGLAREAAALQHSIGATVQQQLDGVSAQLQGTTRALLDGVAQAQAESETASAARDGQRLAALQDSVATISAALQAQARLDSAAAAERQQQICSTLEHTAEAIAARAETHARATITEIQGLVQAAAEAPRAAAELVGELRRALSDSLVRDNVVLEERQRLLGALGGLLDAVNHASTEQRTAIDALVQSTTSVLGHVSARFEHTVESESRTLQTVAAQVAGSAAEVASLGEGFGAGVQLFSRASEQLTAQLQRIESALGQTLTRSDEQLAYYVAQAREIIDLTLGSQKQIVDELQQLARSSAGAPKAAPAEAALA